MDFYIHTFIQIYTKPNNSNAFFRNAANAADSTAAVVSLINLAETGLSSAALKFAMSEAARGAAATTAEMRRGRRRVRAGGGGGEPVWRGVLSLVATMHTFALAASSLFGAAGKTTLM